MPLFVLEPLAYYVHHYNGPVIERVLPLSEARKACAGRGVHADACAWTSNGACHLIIPSNGPVRNRGAYRRHERRIATAGITPATRQASRTR
jgi:hypothetical protein